MRRSFQLFLPMLLLISSLMSGCSITSRDSVATGPTARPTAYTLPASSPTGAVSEAVPTASVEPTPVPTEAIPPTSQPNATVEPTPSVPIAAEPTPESAAPTAQAPTPASTEVVPTAIPEPVPATPTVSDISDHIITIAEPLPGALLSSPFVVRGATNFWPFEATLSGVLKDGAGNVLAAFPVMVQSPGAGQPGPFSEQVSFAEPTDEQQGTLEIYEESPEDGSVITFTSILVRLGAAVVPASLLQIEQPAEGASVTTPLHVAFAGAKGDEHLVLRLTQADGSILAQEIRASHGFGVTTMLGNVVPGPATLDIVRDDGRILGRRTLQVVPLSDTQMVKVAWLKPGSEQIVLVERQVPRTPQIATAALVEMLWGPSPGEAFATSLPTPAEVLASGVRGPNWGPRVRLLKLTITDGVALANFGPELNAYGGGSARVVLIRKQIEATLEQFPSVDKVVIAIDGQTEGILQP